MDSSDLRILVAEDNSVNRFILNRLFSKWNMHVDMVHHGGMAVEQFQTTSYDMVLLDLYMPVKDGFEAAREIRQLNADVPIIGITAAPTEKDRPLVVSSGMNQLVEKPFSAEVMQELLQRYFPS